MADNIAITAGVGTTIATDDVSNVHYQRVKLVDGTLDSVAAIPGSATDGLLVNLGTNNDVTATLSAETTKVIGTVNIAMSQSIEVTQSTPDKLVVLEPSASNIMDAVQLIDDTVFDDDAAFTVGTSKVLVSGFLADDASPDVSDEGDAVAARCTLDRKQIVMVGESGANFVRGGGAKTNTTDQSIMEASGNASIYNYLCWVSVYNSSTTNTYVNVKDGSTVVAVLPLPAYGGAIFNLPVPIRGTGNTAFNLATGASVTTAYLYGGGYKGY
jgi:hypothetical protein